METSCISSTARKATGNIKYLTFHCFGVPYVVVIEIQFIDDVDTINSSTMTGYYTVKNNHVSVNC